MTQIEASKSPSYPDQELGSGNFQSEIKREFLLKSGHSGYIQSQNSSSSGV